MNKRLILILSVLSLSLSLIPANAAAKAGTSCKKAGITSIASGKTFTCVKAGNKLVWNKGIQNKKTSSSTNFLYAPPSELSDDIELCKIKEANLNSPRSSKQALPSGFPSTTPPTKNFGNVKWAVIPIDFPDLKGESSFRSRVDNQIIMLSDWYKTVSEGNLSIDWVVQDKWITLPKNSTDYAMPFSSNLIEGSNGAKLFSDAMQAADPSFDFTGIQTVNFILPKGQTFISESVQGFPVDDVVKNVVTKEGSVSSFSIAGKFFDSYGRSYWPYWAHEFGHAIGISHVGRSREPAPLYAGYDLMASQDGPTRELSGWLRFLVKWLPDEKVYCKEAKNVKSVDLTLIPLNGSDPGIKLAVVPLTSNKAIVIESRRVTKFTCDTTPKQNGVLAYIYDATLSHGEDFLILLTPNGRKAISSPCPASITLDSLLRAGDKISIDGITIENLALGNFDKIRISKTA